MATQPELEKNLEALARQTHSTPNEIIKQLINHYLKQKQESQLLADIAETLPELACCKGQDPLAVQQAMRYEWR